MGKAAGQTAYKGRSSHLKFDAYKNKRREASFTKRIVDAPESSEGEKAQRNRGFFELLASFWGLIGSSTPVVYFALSTRTVATLIGLAEPVLMKVVIDYVLLDEPGPEGLPTWVKDTIGTDPYRILYIVAAAMIALPLIKTGIALIGRWQLTKLTRTLSARVRRKVFSHAIRLPMHRVHRIKSGGVSSLLREDAGSVSDLNFTLLYNPWQAIVQLFGTLIVLAFVRWELVVGGVLLVPVVWFTHQAWIKRIRPIYRDVRATRVSIDAQATEAFSGMRVVRAFNRERAERTRFTTRDHLTARMELLAWVWSRALEAVWDIMIPLAMAGVVIYAGGLVLQDRLMPGDVAMFVMYLAMLLSPLATLAQSATGVQSQLAGLDRVLDLLEQPTELTELPGAVPVRRATTKGRLELDHVTFTYPSISSGKQGEPSLRDVSLVVEPGQTIALVGPSGAGKTTLCNLVARFYDPTEGRVLLDGRDLREIEIRSYRSMLGVVEQDVFLFDGSIAENIAYARRHASHAEIRAAAVIAHADEFISKLEHGYDTLIGERGVRLSGGQKQRIAIARAVLADPVVLILDEATSNLDSESEAYIQAGMRDLLKGRTTFVIAHRLSTIRDADQIVVIEDGRIVERGDHQSLLNTGGRYAEFLYRQVEHPATDDQND